ncbi:MAG: aminoacyl-tRNA hydrolase [Deltaproteobacteria bacterium]|nr:MAG: aminoacyl-tRNA hydrolase [Deltaproteobacteria bacterium]
MSKSQKPVLIVGLGNPGTEYEETRHNIGFKAVHSFAEKYGSEIRKKGFSSYWAKLHIEERDVYVQLPQTYMNLSGQAVREILDYYRVSPAQLVLVHDELDLPLGKLKKGFSSGAAGHRGVSSVIEHLGTKDFWRIRMGVGRPEGPGHKGQISDFVLHRFTQDEEKIVDVMIKESESLLNKIILEV